MSYVQKLQQNSFTDFNEKNQYLQSVIRIKISYEIVSTYITEVILIVFYKHSNRINSLLTIFKKKA